MVDLDDITDFDVDEGKMALISGIGFVLLAVYFYFVILNIEPVDGVEYNLIFGILLLAFALLFPFLFYLDEMSFAPASLGDTASKFLAGIIFMLMVVVLALIYQDGAGIFESIGMILIAIPSISFLIHSVLA